MTIAWLTTEVYIKTKLRLISIYNGVKERSKRWAYLLIVTWCTLLIATTGIQISMVTAYQEQEGSHDVPYNPWFPATMNGLTMCLYAAVLSALVLWSIQAYSRNAVTCFSVTLIGYLLLDMAVFFYYPLRLVTRCSLSDFNGIMRKCRAEFSDVLMVVRRGSTPMMFSIVGVLHGLVISFSLAVMIAVLIRKKQVKYEVNGRGNGHGISQESYTDFDDIELK
ncbi:hypothetical protein DAPPUDRAFT_314894 [Daphnia pulex]|uniref:Uncharacterized protein n=1 Tax=Daphnia pulex TaxID=6669 RepID=E9G7V2_DAPPU|nr:hypothetical protein DAPPUDRAFT_314894 [Daphnia pulex]|eukprot:EFX84595.1 hypothetical protein DAPPUDRAFT_314894 [Daphnia pulex]